MVKPSRSGVISNPLLLLLAILTVSSFGAGSSEFIPIYGDRLGLSSALIGLLSTAFFGMSAVGAICSGRLSDRMQTRKRFIILGLFSSSITYLAFSFHISGYQLLALRAVQGLAFAFFATPLRTLISVSSMDVQHGKIMGYYGSFHALGLTLAFIAGGLIARQFGIEATFMLSALLLLSCSLLGFVIHERGNSQTRDKLTSPLHTVRTSLRELRHFDRSYIFKTDLWKIYIIFFLRDASYCGVFAFLPLYILKLGGDYTIVGIMSALQMAPQIALMPIMGQVSDKVGRRPLMFSGAVVTFFAILALSQAESYSFIALIMLLFSASYSAFEVGVSSYIADATLKQHRGEALGLLNSVMNVSMGAGPLFAGLILASGAFNYSTMQITLSALPLCSLLLIFKLAESKDASSMQK